MKLTDLIAMDVKWVEAKPKYRVVDNAYNRANYPGLIGKEYHNPPGYAAVHFLDNHGNVVKSK